MDFLLALALPGLLLFLEQRLPDKNSRLLKYLKYSQHTCTYICHPVAGYRNTD